MRSCEAQSQHSDLSTRTYFVIVSAGALRGLAQLAMNTLPQSYWRCNFKITVGSRACSRNVEISTMSSASGSRGAKRFSPSQARPAT